MQAVLHGNVRGGRRRSQGDPLRSNGSDRRVYDRALIDFARHLQLFPNPVASFQSLPTFSQMTAYLLKAAMQGVKSKASQRTGTAAQSAPRLLITIGTPVQAITGLQSFRLCAETQGAHFRRIYDRGAVRVRTYSWSCVRGVIGGSLTAGTWRC